MMGPSRSNLRLGSPISLPKLRSDPYKYDYQRRRTKSVDAEASLLLMRNSTLFLAELREEVCKSSALEQWSPAQVWSPPDAERLQRLISELESIQISEHAPSPASAPSSIHAAQSSVSISTASQPPASSRSSIHAAQSSTSISTASQPPASSKSASPSIRATQSRTRKTKPRNSPPRKSHSEARCPHGLKRFTSCPHAVERTRCPHGFRLISAVCPHGYAKAACALHLPAQRASAHLASYEDSIFEKTAQLFM
ncbi:hypothetical protein R3P38DRAFT_3374939 [Favolaschia claudopus]|uniref:C3H1-type domain-containing protein n=1 Tax=Favolaschia claudopus TaxID=2862362 RepID=A0AAV9ZKU4_9AGAR